ncbi:hypothetical protein ACHQM5_030619 [Ranunculus cassubicifolius]
MATQEENPKIYSHYNHIDSCNFSRWTAKECYEFMYDRPWKYVGDFYSNLVNGRYSLPLLLFHKDRPLYTEPRIDESAELTCVSMKGRTGRWERVTFKILLSYHGNSFDGWQRQPGLNTVQSIVEKSVGRFVDEKKAQKLKDKGLPLEGSITVAGRTDKGVTALKQVCSFYTWRKDVEARDVEDAINEVAPGNLRVVSVSKVSREFHPNFSAKWRRYFYIFPMNYDGEKSCNTLGLDDAIKEEHQNLGHGPDPILDDPVDCESGKKPTSFSIQKVNQLLLQLQGKSLSYAMFARDTKASRSTGPPTECIMYHARAVEATLPCQGGKGIKAMCVELIGNRFLRRMVRVLVATSIREAAAGADDDALLKLLDATCRRATAPPAPADGLCLADVGYTVFNPKDCLIP